MLRRKLATLVVAGFVLSLAVPTAVLPSAYGQMVGISTPFNAVSDSFFERIGMGFGFQLQGGNPAGGSSAVVGLLPGGFPTQNIGFNQGGFQTALPPFGGHDPNGDANLGFALLKGGNGAFFNFAGGQGNTRTFTNQTPSVTITNGQQGTFSDTSQTPFVTAIIPVVGDAFIPPYYPTMAPAVHPLHERLERLREMQKQQGTSGKQRAEAAAQALGNENLSREDKLSLKAEASRGSSAGRGDLSVAEIKNQQAAEEAAKQTEVQGFIERAKGAEEAGKTAVAKIYYRQALSRATGDLRNELQAKLQALGK